MTRDKDKKIDREKNLFGIPKEQLGIVTGGGGVIIQVTRELVVPVLSPAP